MKRRLLLAAFPLGALVLLVAVLVVRRGGVGGVGPAAAADEPRELAAELVRTGGVRAESGLSTDEALDRSPVAAEPPRGPEPSADPVFHGRVLDRATGERVSGVAVTIEGDFAQGPVSFPPLLLERTARSEGVPVDGAGRFAFDEPLPAEATHIAVTNPLQRTHVRTLKVAELVADPLGGWLVQIAIGPTFRFDPLGARDFEAADFEARLVEIAADGVEHEGSWLRIQPSSPPWLRYDNPWEPNAAGSRLRVDLRERDGARAGSSALLKGPAIGIHADVVPIALDRLQVVLTGRVVDTAGRPKQHVSVLAAPLGAASGGGPARRARGARTDDEGRFAIAGLALGPVQLTARPRRGEPPVARRVVLDRAVLDVGDLVVSQQTGLGMIHGRLVSAAGRALTRPEYVRLRALDGRGIELFDVSSEGSHSYHGRNVDGTPFDGHHTFDFNEVPAGEFELSVVSQNGYRWQPETLRVTAPDAKAVFVRQDDAPSVEYAFVVRRAADGAPVEEYVVCVEVPGSLALPLPTAQGIDLRIMKEVGLLAPWLRSFHLPADLPFTWTLSAPGLRAVRGDQTAFAPVRSLESTADGAAVEVVTLVATVDLPPGFAARLRFRDYGAGHGHDDDEGLVHAAEAPRVDGVRIRAAGPLVGESSNGDAWIELEREPTRLELDAPGWALLESDAFRNGRIVGPSRDVVVWMVRD